MNSNRVVLITIHVCSDSNKAHVGFFHETGNINFYLVSHDTGIRLALRLALRDVLAAQGTMECGFAGTYYFPKTNPGG